MLVLGDSIRYFKKGCRNILFPASSGIEVEDIPLLIKLVRCIVYRDNGHYYSEITLEDIERVDWSRIHPLLFKERMLSWMAYCLKRSNLLGQVPVSCRHYLKYALLNAQVNFRESLSCYNELSGALGLVAIEHAPLKGVFLGKTIYRNLPYRTMGDVDIWVKQADVRKAHAYFMDHGYRALTFGIAGPYVLIGNVPLPKRSGKYGRICYMKGDSLVDVHWSPVYFFDHAEKYKAPQMCWVNAHKVNQNDFEGLFSKVDTVSDSTLRFHLRLILAHCLSHKHTSWQHYLDMGLLISETAVSKPVLVNKVMRMCTSELACDVEKFIDFLFDLIDVQKNILDIIDTYQELLCGAKPRSVLSRILTMFKFRRMGVNALKEVTEQKEKYLIEDLPPSLGPAIILHLDKEMAKEEYLSVCASVKTDISPNKITQERFSSLSPKLKKQIKLVIGCGVAPFAEKYFQSAFRKVCFIREPVDYALLLYDNICRQWTSTTQDDCGCMAWGPLLESVVEGDRPLPVDQWYVRNERLILTSHQLVRRFIKADLILSHEEAFHAAKEILDDCYFVGIVGQQQDYELLFEMLGASRGRLFSGQSERSHVKPEVIDSLRGLMMDRYHLEYELYEYALSLNKIRSSVLYDISVKMG